MKGTEGKVGKANRTGSVRGDALEAGASASLAMAGLFALASGSSASPSTLYVSTAAKPGGAGTSCATSRYRSIPPAIAAASAGSTVVVYPGAYVGQVVVTKPVVLREEGATIVANGNPTGTTVPVPGVTIEGFTVRGASFDSRPTVSGETTWPISRSTWARCSVDLVVQRNGPGRRPLARSNASSPSPRPPPRSRRARALGNRTDQHPPLAPIEMRVHPGKERGEVLIAHHELANPEP